LLHDPSIGGCTLCFKKYDKETRDGIQSTKPLKPNFVGVDDTETQDTRDILCWWSLLSPETEKNGKDVCSLPIMVPGEAKANWQQLVMPSGTYAQSPFTASPLCSFTLRIAVNHTKQELGYLSFPSWQSFGFKGCKTGLCWGCKQRNRMREVGGD